MTYPIDAAAPVEAGAVESAAGIRDDFQHNTHEAEARVKRSAVRS